MSEERKWLASDGATELKPGIMVLVRESEVQSWTVSIFSHVEDGFFVCAGLRCGRDCIPLEGNEYMTGTTFPVTNKAKPRRGDYVIAIFYDDDGKRHVRTGMYVDFVEEKNPTPHAVIYDYELQVSYCHECNIDRERNEGERGQR